MALLTFTLVWFVAGALFSFIPNTWDWWACGLCGMGFGYLTLCGIPD